MINYNSRIKKIEKIIDEIVNPYEEVAIIINETTGETLEQKISEKEKELGKKVKPSMIVRVRAHWTKNKVTETVM